MTAGNLAGPAGAAPRNASRLPLSRASAPAVAADALPIYVGPVDSRLFGWLHLAAARPPSPGAASKMAAAPARVPPLAVLICAPLGPQDLASHRGLRRLAPALAAAGLPVLRFDHAGWGDSAELTVLPAPTSFDAGAAAVPRHDPPARWLRDIDAAADELRLRTAAPRLALVGMQMGALLADIARALAWLRSECGVGRCDVVGLCSGAYHAWRAAPAGVALSTVVSVNPVVFHWTAGMSLEPVAHAFGCIALAADARRSLRDPKRWAKLLRGQVDVGVIAAALGGRLADHARGAARLAGVPLVDDLAAELCAVAGRGVRLCFVFAEGAPGRALLAHGAGRMLARLTRHGDVSADHRGRRPHLHARTRAPRAVPRVDAAAGRPCAAGRRAVGPRVERRLSARRAGIDSWRSSMSAPHGRPRARPLPLGSPRRDGVST